MATFEILSDLHLEMRSGYTKFTITPKAAYLALLGDIGVINGDKLEYRVLPFTNLLLKQLKQSRLSFMSLETTSRTIPPGKR